MTKTKALELMLKNDRALIDPALARKIAKAFGYTLSELGLKPKKTKDYQRVTYSNATANLSSIATYQLAESIAQKFDDTFQAPMPFHGMGSNAEWATQKSVEFIKIKLSHKGELPTQ